MTYQVPQTPRANWTLSRVQSPTERVVSVEEIKRAIRISVEDNYHDSTLLMYADSATMQVEKDCTMQLMQATFLLASDCFPLERYIYLPLSPVMSIESITYENDQGEQLIVDPATYRLDIGQPTVSLKRNASWPFGDNVQVTFLAGFGNDPMNVPGPLRQAVMLQVGKWFANPSMDLNDIITGNDMAYERIIGRYMRGDMP